MENIILIEVAVMLITGILFGRIAKLLKLPNVTGYLLAGLLLGPSAFNFIPSYMVDNYAVISDIALGFIAFSIGSEFNLSYFKKVGISPLIIAACESLGASLLVMLVCLLFGFDPMLSIILGAIAAATAPAQTIMVINQYKAKGSLTSMLMSVVAIDDATALIGFGFATTIVTAVTSKAHTNILISIFSPIYQIIISFIIGVIASLLMKLTFRFFKKSSNRICILIAFILFTYWASEAVHGSSLLACMALGGVWINISDDSESVINIIEAFTPPIFMVFFIISGAGFELSALGSIGLIGVVYVVMRIIGKIAGAYIGGRLTGQEDKICKYLGPTLMPQAGVALGLIVVAGNIVPAYALQIRTIILCSTFIYSIIGPIAAKMALSKSGELNIT